MTKRLTVAVLAVVLISGMVFIVPQTYAQSTTPSTQPNFFQNLVQFISQKFGLDKTQVQNAVNEFHNQNVQNREQKRLDNLVKAGKITATQEQAMKNEKDLLRSKYNFTNLTPEQRRTQMQNLRNEWITWKQSQGINQNIMFPFFGIRGEFRRVMRDLD